MNKKNLLIGAVVLCLVFAGGFSVGFFLSPKPNIGNARMRFDNNRGRHIKNRINSEFYPEMSPEKQIQIDEKRLEKKKELTKSTPDWTKIENINKEIALERAASKTEYLKQMKQQNTVSQ